jgi:hypothetical protein
MAKLKMTWNYQDKWARVRYVEKSARSAPPRHYYKVLDCFERSSKLWLNSFILAKTAASDLRIGVPEIEIIASSSKETDLQATGLVNGMARKGQIFIFDKITDEQLPDTVFHEVRHVWQYETSGKFNEDDADEYAESFIQKIVIKELGLFP